MAENVLATVPDLARRAPRSAGGVLAAAVALDAGPLEIAVVGPAGELRDALVRRAWQGTSPGAVVAVWDGAGPGARCRCLRAAGGPGAGAESVPLAHVCRGMVCARPVATVAELAALLS